MNPSGNTDFSERLIPMLASLPRLVRGKVMLLAASFRSGERLEEELAVGPIRAAFADYWEQSFKESVPIVQLRALLTPPVALDSLLEFSGLNAAGNEDEVGLVLTLLLKHLWVETRRLRKSPQLTLFDAMDSLEAIDSETPAVISSVASLSTLVDLGIRYPTIYADPPWQYKNTASRAAASNHYPTMTLEEICQEPVRDLVTENAHLHLWTTNGFLQDAFEVVHQWGFEFKSCLVWVKDKIGMGNYWRMSHEYLLLGVRGNLRFQDRKLPSWIQAARTTHSRKPDIVRTLVERVSPGPYLELYGRQQLPDSRWTVYGNQIEKRLF